MWTFNWSVPRPRCGWSACALVSSMRPSYAASFPRPGWSSSRCGRTSWWWCCPASHELAACREVELSQLEAVPLRLVSRRLNQPLVDLVVGSCARAGFEPLLRPGSHTLQDTLAEIGTGPPTWTVLYAAHAQILNSKRVAFRPVAAPGLIMTTALAVPSGATTGFLAPLLRACAEAARTDQSS